MEKSVLTTETKKFNRVKLKGKAMYAKVHQLDTKFEPKWTLDLLLDAESLKMAQEMNLRVKNDRDIYKNQFKGYEDGWYIRIDRPLKDRDGDTNDPPKVIDSKLRDVPSHVQIGNGSEVNVQFFIKNGNPAALKKWGGYGAYLLGVQILKLEEFRRSNPDTDFVEEDGDGAAGSFSTSEFTDDDADANALPFDKAAV
jgi:hypothetical protein